MMLSHNIRMHVDALFTSVLFLGTYANKDAPVHSEVFFRRCMLMTEYEASECVYGAFVCLSASNE